MSLRRRVVLGCLAVALVLLAADLVLAGTFRGFLLQRVDGQLVDAAGRFTQLAGDPDGRGGDGPRGGGPRGGPGGPDGRGIPFSEFYAAVYDADGELVGRIGDPLHADEEPPAPAAAEVVAQAKALGQLLQPFTASSAGGQQWRLVAVSSATGGDILVVGSNLGAIGPTYDRMILVLLLATAAVYTTLALVGWWVLRQGVRPLAAMTATAEAIAGNDLAVQETSRIRDNFFSGVADGDERTEAGRLAIALNTMLERLQAAFAQREASEQRLRRFVADASHELRTPLTSIRGYAELYRAGGLCDAGDLDGAMLRVEQEGRRMGTLVEDLLLLAKLDQGRPLEQRPVDLAQIVRDAAADLAAVQPDRPLAVEAADVSVVGDDGRLRQAVGNLIANVRVHTPPTTPVRIRVVAEDDDAVIEVADDGPGMSAEVEARVFERFYRADPARARASGGSGLGLSIAAGIVEAHGGEVSVVAAPDRGATFRIRLPRSVRGTA